MNYLLKGDIVLAGIISGISVIIMFYLITYLKKRKVHISKTKVSAVSVILWIIFILIVIPIDALIFHALNVELNAKSDLQNYSNNLLSKNHENITLFKKKNQTWITDNITVFESKLNKYLNSKGKERDDIETDLKAPPFNQSDRIIGDIKDFRDIKYPSANLKKAWNTKRDAILRTVSAKTSEVELDYKPLVDNWSRFDVVRAVLEIENMVEMNSKKLDSFLVKEHFITNLYDPDPKELVKGGVEFKRDDGILTLERDEYKISSWNEMWEKYKPYWLFAPLFVFNFLLVLPYFLVRTGGTYVKSSRRSKSNSDIEGIEL